MGDPMYDPVFHPVHRPVLQRAPLAAVARRSPHARSAPSTGSSSPAGVSTYSSRGGRSL